MFITFIIVIMRFLTQSSINHLLLAFPFYHSSFFLLIGELALIFGMIYLLLVVRLWSTDFFLNRKSF